MKLEHAFKGKVFHLALGEIYPIRCIGLYVFFFLSPREKNI